jgi:phage FluMu protein Com
MGMFDSVWVKCPNCKTKNEFQSKSGDCFLKNYSLKKCPPDVLVNVNRHSPIKCQKCDTLYEVDIARRKAVIIAGAS